MKSSFRRQKFGGTLAETPVALAVFFLFLMFPLIDLATIALRSATAYSAATNGVHAAALAPTFLNDSQVPDPISGAPTLKLSAVHAAVKAAQATKSAGLTGCDFNDTDIKVRIIGIALKPESGLPALQGQDGQPLTLIDPNYVYELEVTVAAQVSPLFTLSDRIFGAIPGLTVPIPLTVSSRQISENSGGLTH